MVDVHGRLIDEAGVVGEGAALGPESTTYLPLQARKQPGKLT